MSMTPTARSLAEMRKRGYHLVQVVEVWNSFTRTRRDLFGMFDILCVRRGETCAVQTTTRHNMEARRRKIIEHENIGAVREAEWVILVHGWEKNRDGRWQLTELDVS